MNTSEKIKEGYQKKFQKYGFDPRSLYWKGKGAAHQRFRQFWAEIDFTGKSVLDIGCGFGELGKFLLKRYEGVKYTGIDITPEFIETAKKEIPNGSFFVADLFKDKIEGHYDIVIASGVLNSKIEGNNMEYRKNAIEKMFSLTQDIFAFNMLGSHPQPDNEEGGNVWYADSLKILEYCMSLTRRVILRHHYNPKDFTILMYKVVK